PLSLLPASKRKRLRCASVFRRRAGDDRGRFSAVHPRLGQWTGRLPLLSGLWRDCLLHQGRGISWPCGRPRGRVRRSVFPGADEVGLGRATTFLGGASRRERPRGVVEGEVPRPGPACGNVTRGPEAETVFYGRDAMVEREQRSELWSFREGTLSPKDSVKNFRVEASDGYAGK